MTDYQSAEAKIDGLVKQIRIEQERTERFQAKADALAAELAATKQLLDEYHDLLAELAATVKGHDAAHAACVGYEARIRELEAALRDVLNFADITKPVDADALTEHVREAWLILRSAAETSCDDGDQSA